MLGVNRYRFAISVLLVAVLSELGAIGRGEDKAPSYIRFLTNEKNQVVAGLLGKESETEIEVVRLSDGQSKVFKKAEVRQIRKDISEQELISAVGLPSFLTWRIRQVVPLRIPEGTVAKVDTTAIYVTLGLDAGVKEGHELKVYRGETELKDPGSGKVIGKERRLIAKLKVFESRPMFAKARLQGDLEISPEVGDSVEAVNANNAIVILPFVDANGRETLLGKELSEELVTSLVKHRISVVERSLLDKVLGELALQQTVLVDPAAAQRVGKQIGGYAVLVGSIAESGANADVELRLVEVETGRVMFSLSNRLFGKSLGEYAPTRSNDRARPNAKLIAHWAFDGDLVEAVQSGRLEGHKAGAGEISFGKGVAGKCIRSDGISFVRVAHDRRLDLWDRDFTVAFWFKADDVIRHEGKLLAKGDYNKKGWIIDLSAGRQFGSIRLETHREDTTVNGQIVSASGIIETGKWQFVCVSIQRQADGRRAEIYVDAKVVASGKIGSGVIDSDQFDLEIAKVAGCIDEVVVLDQAVDVRGAELLFRQR